jgi:hypothetical protein
MANVSFAHLIDFNMSTVLLGYQLTLHGADDDWIVGTPTAAYEFEGSGLQYEGGTPAGGTVTGFAYLSLTTKDINVTGLSLDFALLAPLLIGGLDAQQQTNLIWQMLTAMSTFSPGTVAMWRWVRSSTAVRIVSSAMPRAAAYMATMSVCWASRMAVTTTST